MADGKSIIAKVWRALLSGPAVMVLAFPTTADTGNAQHFTTVGPQISFQDLLVSAKAPAGSKGTRPFADNSTIENKKMSRARHSRPPVPARSASKRMAVVTTGRNTRRRYYERFSTSSYAKEQTQDDIVAGEDPAVRAAALDALGNMNGTVVAIDPTSGRILAMVNQKLALSEGAPPCSTVKIAVALAGLNENLITKETKISLGGSKVDLTEALARSNNAFFELLGRRLGFEKLRYYAHQFGLGELAGYNIAGERPGTFPEEELDAKRGGVGRMCSFGESISMTPLQLGALVSAIANGGTLYYLQHPETQEQVASFARKVKRNLNIAQLIPQISDGMAGAVQYGTARTVRLSFNEEQVLGKTGTCSNNGTRFGWFASYANIRYASIAVVVFIRGGWSTFGPKAAEIAGRIYRNLYDQGFFAGKDRLAERSVHANSLSKTTSDGAPFTFVPGLPPGVPTRRWSGEGYCEAVAQPGPDNRRARIRRKPPGDEPGTLPELLRWKFSVEP